MNEFTGERIGWRPHAAASRQKGNLPVPSDADIREDVPAGWVVRPSQSRPGEFSYVNQYTGTSNPGLGILNPTFTPSPTLTWYPDIRIECNKQIK